MITKTDPKTCKTCGKRFMSASYRRQHEREPFAHIAPAQYLTFTTGRKS
jgi:hypothetical protein